MFADSLTQLLTSAGTVEIVGAPLTAQAAFPLIAADQPDALIVASAKALPPATFGQFLAAYPDLPIIYADLSADDVQVITSQRVGTRSSDLLAAIAALPKRS